MTGISPLEKIHKKGLFGNHFDKRESDLLKITEIKNQYIIQVVKYKTSNTPLNSIKIHNVPFPEKNLTIAYNEQTRILWTGPNTWLIISKMENIAKIVEEKCKKEDFAITDITHSRAVIQIKGFQANEVLKKGCPINFNEFKNNNCVGTVFQGVNVLIDKIDDKPETYNLFALRSFGESFYHDITDAALENGYVGV